MSAAGILRGLVEVGWQAGLLALLVLAAELLLGRALRPRWRYGLWSLVVLRFALPWSPEVTGAPLRWQVESVARPFPAWADPGGTRPSPSTPSPREAPASRAPGPARSASPFGRVPAEGDRLPRALPSGDAARPASPPRRVDWAALLAAAWGIGALLRFGLDLGREWSFRRRLLAARPARDADLLALVAGARASIGLRRPVEVLETTLVRAPAVCGTIRPRLLVPPGIGSTMSTATLRQVVLHELFHVRHHDVAVNLLLSALRAVHWFHPLAHLALRRLLDARESVRDWQALACSPPRSSRAYAEALLCLASPPPKAALGIGPHGRDLKRRILMITAFDRLAPRTPLATATGLALLFSLGWIAFTQAAPPAVLAPLDAGATNSDLQRIESERESPPPAWHEDVERRLQTRVAVELDDATLEQAIEFVRASSGLNVVLGPDVQDWSDATVTLVAADRSVRQVLTLVCRSIDPELDFTVWDGVVVLDPRGALPSAVDMRFYRLAPLLEDVAPDERDSRVDEIIEATLHFTTDDGEEWNQGQTAIETWNGLLVVVQTDAMHARVETFLNLLLNRGRRPPEAPPAWLVDLGRRLDARVSTEFENTPAREAVAQLAARAEVPIVLPPHVEEEVSLVLDDVPLRTALGWIARQFELRVALEDGAIVLTENPRPRIEIYEVGELIAPRRAGEGDGEVDGAFLREQLVELIRQHVDPESWEWDPRRAIQPFADDLLVVRQGEEQHARIRSMLAALRRALARGV